MLHYYGEADKGAYSWGWGGDEEDNPTWGISTGLGSQTLFEKHCSCK